MQLDTKTDRKRNVTWFKGIKPLVSVVKEKDNTYVYTLTSRGEIEQIARDLLGLLKATKNAARPDNAVGEHVSIAMQVGVPGRIGFSCGFITDDAQPVTDIFEDLEKE